MCRHAWLWGVLILYPHDMIVCQLGNDLRIYLRLLESEDHDTRYECFSRPSGIFHVIPYAPFLHAGLPFQMQQLQAEVITEGGNTALTPVLEMCGRRKTGKLFWSHSRSDMTA